MEHLEITYRQLQDFLLLQNELTKDELDYYDRLSEIFSNSPIEKFSIACEEV